MRILASTNRRAIDALCARDVARDPAVAATAARIVSDVRQRGDAGLRHWMKRLDGVEPPFEITAAELRKGWSDTPRDVRRAIRVAAKLSGGGHALRVYPRTLRTSRTGGRGDAGRG